MSRHAHCLFHFTDGGDCQRRRKNGINTCRGPTRSVFRCLSRRSASKCSASFTRPGRDGRTYQLDGPVCWTDRTSWMDRADPTSWMVYGGAGGSGRTGLSGQLTGGTGRNGRQTRHARRTDELEGTGELEDLDGQDKRTDGLPDGDQTR